LLGDGVLLCARIFFRFTFPVIGNRLMPELKGLVRQRNFNGLKKVLCDFPAPDIAEIFVDLKLDDKEVLLRLCHAGSPPGFLNTCRSTTRKPPWLRSRNMMSCCQSWTQTTCWSAW